MSLGYIKTTKIIPDNRVVEVYVKPWRARLAEMLLGKSLIDVEAEIKRHLEDKYDKELEDEANRIVACLYKDFNHQIDQELIELFDFVEKPIKILDMQEFNSTNISEVGYIEHRVNGRIIRIPKRLVVKKEQTT